MATRPDGSVRSANPVGGVMIDVAIPALSMFSSENDRSQFSRFAFAPTLFPAAAFTRNGGLKWWWKSIARRVAEAAANAWESPAGKRLAPPIAANAAIASRRVAPSVIAVSHRSRPAKYTKD